MEIAMWDAFMETKELFPDWNSPKLEVVYWDGESEHGSGTGKLGCGCNPHQELVI